MLSFMDQNENLEFYTIRERELAKLFSHECRDSEKSRKTGYQSGWSTDCKGAI